MTMKAEPAEYEALGLISTERFIAKTSVVIEFAGI